MDKLTYPTWLFHPTEPDRIFKTKEDVEQAVEADARWRDRPYSAEEKLEHTKGDVTPPVAEPEAAPVPDGEAPLVVADGVVTTRRRGKKPAAE